MEVWRGGEGGTGWPSEEEEGEVEELTLRALL